VYSQRVMILIDSVFWCMYLFVLWYTFDRRNGVAQSVSSRTAARRQPGASLRGGVLGGEQMPSFRHEA
jgi:hypothetical protein